MMEKTLTDSFRKKFKGMSAYAGYVLYFFDLESKSSEWIALPRITPIIDIERTEETFILDKPAFTLDGKPVFVLVRGLVSSVGLDFESADKPNIDELLAQAKVINIPEEDLELMSDHNVRMIPNLPTPSEIFHKTRSAYALKVFKRALRDMKQFWFIVCLMALSSAITYIITSNYYINLDVPLVGG